MVQFQLTWAILLDYHQLEQSPQFCDIVGAQAPLGALYVAS